jgi:hypothetical protein
MIELQIVQQIQKEGWHNIHVNLNRTIKACRGKKEIGYFEINEYGKAELKETKNYE